MPTLVYGTCLPTTGDGQLSTLQKILQCGAGGAGGGTLSGAGPPGAGTGSDGDLYVDTTNKDIYIKIAGAWELAVDVI